MFILIVFTGVIAFIGELIMYYQLFIKKDEK